MCSLTPSFPTKLRKHRTEAKAGNPINWSETAPESTDNKAVKKVTMESFARYRALTPTGMNAFFSPKLHRSIAWCKTKSSTKPPRLHTSFSFFLLLTGFAMAGRRCFQSG